MEFKILPQEILIELLHFLAENEDFDCVEKMLGDNITPAVAGSALRELAEQLQMDLASKESVTKFDDVKSSGLSPEARRILTSLSPREERRLYRALGLVEKKTV